MISFGDVEVSEGFVKKFLDPGVEVVRFSEISGGTASTGTPFISFTVENNAGLTTEDKLYFAEGKNRQISVETIYNWLAITNRLDIKEQKEQVKALMPSGETYEEIASKLATLMVGKSFAMLLKGEWVNGKDLTKKSWIKAKLSGIVATEANKGTLTFDPAKNISGSMDVREPNNNLSKESSTTNNTVGAGTKDPW